MDANAQGTLSPDPGATLQALSSASQEVFNRHNSDAGSASPSASQALGSATEPVADAAAALASRQVVCKATLGFLRATDAAIKNRVGKAARERGSAEWADSLVNEVALPDAQAVEIADLTATVCEKWGLNLKWAPEVALVASLGGYSLGVWFAIRKLNEMEKRTP